MNTEKTLIGSPLEVFAPPNSPVPLSDNNVVFINGDGSLYEPGNKIGEELKKIKCAKVYPNVGYYGINPVLSRSEDDLKRIAEFFSVAQGKVSNLGDMFDTSDSEDHDSGHFDEECTENQMSLNGVIEATVSKTLFDIISTKPPLPQRRNKSAKIHPAASFEGVNLLTDKEYQKSRDKQAKIAAMFCTESAEEAAARRVENDNNRLGSASDTSIAQKVGKLPVKPGQTKASKKNAILGFLRHLRQIFTRK